MVLYLCRLQCIDHYFPDLLVLRDAVWPQVRLPQECVLAHLLRDGFLPERIRHATSQSSVNGVSCNSATEATSPV